MFDLEFNHTADETPAFADRCGCHKCDVFRARAAENVARHNAAQAARAPRPANEIPARGPAVAMARANGSAPQLSPDARREAAQRAVASVAAAAPAIGRIVERAGESPVLVERVQLTPTSAPVEVQRTATNTNATCTCHPNARGLAVRGVCPTCGKRRDQQRERAMASAPMATPNSAATAETARQLGVQTDTRTNANGQRGEILTPREQVQREIADKISGQLGATTRDLRKWDTLLRSTTVSTTANADGHVKHTEVVAGARTQASGIFLGFGGQGSMTRAELAAVLAAAQMPAEWLPAAKSAHAQAGRIVGELSRHGYIVRAARTPVKNGKPMKTDERGWVARWNVGQAILGSNVGGAYGTTLLVVSLLPGGELKIEGREDLALSVRAGFDAACSGEVYAAADVTSWLQATLIGRFRACAVGGNWYVRRRFAADAERLCTELAKHWGRNWLLPAIPMATTEELCVGLVKNFAGEVDAVLKTYRDELAEAKKEARDAGKPDRDVLLGTRRAKTLLAEIRTLAERAVGFGAMFGDRHMIELREKLAAAHAEIAESVDEISQRFELIFDELRREAAKEG